MNNMKGKILLVGDNPFQGVSHLTQERERNRSELITHADYAANLISRSIDNGADGFMFSLDENTISILEIIKRKRQNLNMRLYPTVPSAYGYVRLSSQSGTTGLVMNVAKQMVVSGDFKAIAFGVKGLIETNPNMLLKAYVNYELSRMESVTHSRMHVHSLLLHEIVTDMALALNWDWLFKTYVKYLSKLGVKPGFETRNFCYFVKKMQEWNINPEETVIAAPFNKIGFQMTPSKLECEKVLATIPKAEVIGFSILASGYLKLAEALTYIKTVPALGGVAIGVSTENQAQETFRFFEGIKY